VGPNFAFTCRRLEVECHASAFDPSEHGLLQTFRTEQFLTVLLGRLYYIKDLLTRLSYHEVSHSIPRAELAAALATRAYQSLGLKGLSLLEGDFALAIWDAREHKIVATRDPLGGYPIYWTKIGNDFGVSTNMHFVLQLLPARKLNREYIAAYLMSGGCGWEEIHSDLCAFDGVRRLQPGASLCADLFTGEVNIRTHWDWQNHITDPGTDDLAQTSEEFCSLLRRSVAERMIGRTMCHLSGGFDSTAITLLARRAAADGDSDAPIHTVSLEYTRFPYLAREREYIASVLDENRSLIPHHIEADAFRGYGTIPFHEEPWPALFWSESETAMFDAATAAGMNTLLTGHGSDELVDLEPYHLADDLRCGHWLRVWRESGVWAEECDCNRWNILYPYAIRNSLPSWLRDGWRPLVRSGYSDWYGQGYTTIPPWVLERFAREQGLYQRGRRIFRRAFHSCKPMQLSLALFGIQAYCGDMSRWSIGAPRGIHQAHPFLDPRLISFGLGIQRRLRASPGPPKPILTHALAGLMPEKVRNRCYSGHFNEYFFAGLADRKLWLRSIIREAPIEHLDIFDKQELLRCLDHAALGVARDASTLDRLHLTLSLVIWLSQQEAWKNNHPHATMTRHAPSESSKVGIVADIAARSEN
jgi:asparagine synthase (glutamine-hydrolysing)